MALGGGAKAILSPLNVADVGAKQGRARASQTLRHEGRKDTGKWHCNCEPVPLSMLPIPGVSLSVQDYHHSAQNLALPCVKSWTKSP